MLKSGEQVSIMAKIPLPSPDSTCPSDSECEFTQELEAKRQSIDEEILRFRSDKEKEFRDFEQALKVNRQRNNTCSKNRRNEKGPQSLQHRSKRTSSSSALNLLAGHGVSQSSPTTGSSSRPSRQLFHTKKTSNSSKAGPFPSKPTLSLDPLTIKGETLPQSQFNPPATPTLLTRSLSHTSLSSPKESGSQLPSVSPKGLSGPLTSTAPSREPTESFVGILTPSYLPLLEPESKARLAAASPLVTPPADEADSESTRGLGGVPNNVLPLQSSSFPPSVTTLLPTGTSSKRAYTAPAATRMPSALRSASVGNLAKKRKHVTFRLADSAIVIPSSSYEEGPSPIESGQTPHRSRSATAVSHSSRKSAASRFSNVSPRNGLISDHTRSDEEDEAAGVKPGMSMDEVMQKLNAQLSLEDDEDVGWTDTKYHEDEESDEAYDLQETSDTGFEQADDDSDDDHSGDEVDEVNDGEQTDEDESEEEDDSDSYFSPKFHEMPPKPFGHSSTRSESSGTRDRSGSSPLTPLRDQNWGELSSSDKDRLLFAGRGSDSDSDHRQRPSQNPSSSKHLPHEKTSSSKAGFSGLKKTGSTNSLSSLTSLNKPKSIQSKKGRQLHDTDLKDRLPRFDDHLEPSVDGGSGIGFFELDEELASPTAGKPRPIPDIEADAEHDLSDLDEPLNVPRRLPHGEVTKTEILGTGVASVPINIVRPSVSVSSSWVGTFGH